MAISRAPRRPTSLPSSFELFRDDQWITAAGAIQRQLLAGTAPLRLDLSRTTWADPIPLLQLSCLVARAHDIHPHNTVTLDLGKLGSPHHDRFLLFIAKNGFLSCLAPYCAIRFDHFTYTGGPIDRLLQKIGTTPVAPVYANADCITATILSLNSTSKSEINLFVDNILLEAKRRIDRWLPDSSRQRASIIHKTRQLLSEALDNIAEHAYRGTPHQGYGGVYARIRGGTPESRQDFLLWDQARIAERVHCPAISRNNAGRQPGWLELFVCDVGCGLTTDLSPDLHAPLLSLANQLFNTPISRERDRILAGKTTVTGLQHIGLLLQNKSKAARGDFVRLYSSGEWLGEHLPWPPTGLGAGHRNYRKTLPECLTGTALHFAIETTPAGHEEQALDYPSFYFEPTTDDLAGVRDVLSDTRDAIFLPPHRFFDYKASASSSTIYRGQPFSDRLTSVNCDTLIVRPDAPLRKADIYDQIRAVRANSPAVRRLLYVDLPPLMAIDIGLVLSHQTVPTGGGPLTVYCVTQDWICAAFRLRGDRLEPDTAIPRQFILGVETRFAAAHLAALLRQADSTMFWGSLGDAYLNEMIRWTSSNGSTIEIAGYIDIPTAMSSEAAFESARRATRRSIASFGNDKVITIDALSSSFVGDEFHVYDGLRAIPEGVHGAPVIALGSILVSGSTSLRIAKRPDVSIIGWVHLIRHPQATAIASQTSLQALLWRPPTGNPRIPPLPYERISGSPFLIRGGESAIPLPRYHTSTDKQNGKSLYGQPPDAMYDYWQRLQILRLGHWTYGRHHDLITVDLSQAIEVEFGRTGPIVQWLHTVLNDWQKEISPKPLIFVYPSSRVTDKLVRLLSESAKKNKLTLPALHPLQEIRSSSVSPLIISPIERERLGNLLIEHFRNGGTIVQLDDGEVTGRTMEQLTQVIRGLWEVLREIGLIPAPSTLDVRSIALLDRRATPTQRGLVKQKLRHDQRLWRWDVPTLGNDGHCPLCTTLSRCKDFADRLPDGLLRRRLSYWLDSWSPTPVDQMSFDRGLKPTLVPDGDSTRFGLEKTPSGRLVERSVTHRYSTSRAAVAMEICRSTTRKDYPLIKATQGTFKKRDTDDAPIPIDVQTRIEILVSQIFLYWEELAFMDRVDRLHALTDLLWQSPETTDATSLAALALQIDSGMAPYIWDAIANNVERAGFPHDDTLLAALMTDASCPKLTSRHGAGKSWSLFQIIKNSSHKLQEALGRIFHVLGWNVLSIHGSVLLDLLKASPLTDRELSRTVMVLESLASAFKQILPEMIGSVDIKPVEDASTLDLFVSRLRQLRDHLVAEGDLLPDANDSLGAIKSIAHSKDDVVRILGEVHAFLFVGDPSLQMRYKNSLAVEYSRKKRPSAILDAAHASLNDHWADDITLKPANAGKWAGKTPNFFHVNGSPPDKPLFVYCDALIIKSIAELLSNVVHSDGPIGCPWDSGPTGTADMWSRIEIIDQGAAIRIDLANSRGLESGSCNPRETPASVHLRNVGGRIAPSYDSTSGIFTVSITIPTLAGIAWQRGRS
ncbi:hypothetical protein ACJMQP_23800 [Rhodopseudomonas palustris]